MGCCFSTQTDDLPDDDAMKTNHRTNLIPDIILTKKKRVRSFWKKVDRAELATAVTALVLEERPHVAFFFNQVASDSYCRIKKEEIINNNMASRKPHLTSEGQGGQSQHDISSIKSAKKNPYSEQKGKSQFEKAVMACALPKESHTSVHPVKKTFKPQKRPADNLPSSPGLDVVDSKEDDILSCSTGTSYRSIGGTLYFGKDLEGKQSAPDGNVTTSSDISSFRSRKENTLYFGKGVADFESGPRHDVADNVKPAVIRRLISRDETKEEPEVEKYEFKSLPSFSEHFGEINESWKESRGRLPGLKQIVFPSKPSVLGRLIDPFTPTGICQDGIDVGRFHRHTVAVVRFLDDLINITDHPKFLQHLYDANALHLQIPDIYRSLFRDLFWTIERALLRIMLPHNYTRKQRQSMKKFLDLACMKITYCMSEGRKM